MDVAVKKRLVRPDFVPELVWQEYEENWSCQSRKSPAHMEVAQRLVTDERMDEVYGTLRDQGACGWDWRLFFENMCEWPLERVQSEKKSLKDDRKRYLDIIFEAEMKARDLAELLREIGEIRERSYEAVQGDFSILRPLDLLIRASEYDSEVSYRFNQYVKKTLEDLNCRFDWKYWPRTEELCTAMANSLSDLYTTTREMPAGCGMLTSSHNTWRDSFREFVSGVVSLNETTIHRLQTVPVSSGKVLRLREKDYHTWVQVALNPSYEVSIQNVRDILNKIKDVKKESLFYLAS